ncbi:MAG: hypothetical protein M1840_004905 [Geoglossum simile]|nr:MAG: hypothetical protein M1840_004905 [Geoglossum simile]
MARIRSNYSEFEFDLEIKMIPPNEDENCEKMLVSRRFNTAELCPNVDTAYLIRLGRVDMMHRSDLVISLCTPKEPRDIIRDGLMLDWFGLFQAVDRSESSLISEEVDISPNITTALRNSINCPPCRGSSMPLPLQDTSAIDYGMTSDELASKFAKETREAITRLQEEEDLWSGASEQRLRAQVARTERQIYRLKRVSYWFRRFRMPMIMIVVFTSITTNILSIIAAHRKASHHLEAGHI